MNLVVNQNVWVDQGKGKEFCNKLMQTWLGDDDMLMCSPHDEGKPVIAETFIKILKDKIYKI